MRPLDCDERASEVLMKVHRFLSLTFCLLVLTAEYRAQTWPAKPLHAIVPFAAGTFTDRLAVLRTRP